MSQPFNIPPPPISHKKRAQGFNRANFAKALALVAPGLGQLVLGRFLKGIFFIAITYSIIILKQKDTQTIKYLLLFGVSPFFFSNIGLDLGRLDHFGMLFFILYILAILTGDFAKLLRV